MPRRRTDSATSGVADQLYAEIVETRARLANLMQAYQVLKNLDLAPKRRVQVAAAPPPRTNGHAIAAPLPGFKRGPHAGGSTEAVLSVLGNGEWQTDEELDAKGITGKILRNTLSRLVVKKVIERKGNVGAFSYRLRAGRTMAERTNYDPSGSWPPKLGDKATAAALLARNPRVGIKKGATRALMLSRLSKDVWQAGREIHHGNTAHAQALYVMAKEGAVETKGERPNVKYRLKGTE